MINRFLLFILLITSFTATRAQNLPIGGWKDCLPYRYATGIVKGNGKIYCITSTAIFSITLSDNSIQKYNKVTGLSDINITTAAYDSVYHVLVIGYLNSNVDLLYDNGQVVNVPAIEQAPIVGNRQVNSIYFIGDNAYVSCGFGIVNLNLNNQLINDNYSIIPAGVNVFSVSLLSDTVYAATASGVYYAALKDTLNFRDPSYWYPFQSSSGLPVAPTQFLQSFNDRMYAIQSNSQASVYKYSNNKWSLVNSATNWIINGVSASSADLVLAGDYTGVTNPKIDLISATGVSTTVDSASGLGKPMQALQINGSLWIADDYDGLLHYQNGYNQNLTPNGPYTANDNSIAAYNGNVYVAPANANPVGNTDGFFVYTSSNNTWTNYNQYNTSQIAQHQITDFNNVIISPIDYSVYFGTWSDGVVHFANGAIQTIYNISNSSLQPQYGTTVIASGMAYDSNNNLWVSNYGAKPSPISVFENPTSSANTWYAYSPTITNSNNFYTAMAIDQFNQQWIINTLGGILVMNNNGILTPNNSDLYRMLGTGVGNGNLPSEQVTSIVVDQLGNVWAGTNEGITVFYCPGDELTSSGCDAQQPIYSTSSGNGYLLGTDVINAIVVDGANRKWVATNTGLYLLSADGSSQIENFTAQNSPLFSNNILSLALDPITGNLFIGTSEGILEYRTNSTEGSQTNCDITVFPDPVRQNYFGPITIEGVVANATVKITDINGDLVYETVALGGTATWNGNMQNGIRAKTGVYLVFAASSDGTVHCTGKFLLIN